MKYFTKEVKIGLAGLIALSVLIYGINYLKGIYMFQPSNYFYAHFENANGLTKSSPVFADGVRVGIVRNISYDYTKPGNVTVEVELDTELRIPKGSCAELETELMGGVKMNILLANNPREKYQVGDTIPGLVNSGMMASVNKLLPQVERMLPKVDSILIALNAILTNKSIPATLGSIEKTTANLAVVSHQLKGIVGKDIPQLTQKLNIIGDNFVVISDNLKTIDYAGTFEKIDSTLSNVKLITDKLQSKDNSVGLLLNSPDLYHNLNSTAANASLLLEDLKANPKRYVHFSLFGKKNK
ncbi:MAG: MCE family protein [Bacteroidia bacterium]|nr:MCE family protein [Bacteroidia bacterium]